MIIVNLPDGSKAQFPDGTPPDVMTQAIQAKFPPTGAASAATPPPGLAPGSREYADWARNQAVAGKTLPQVSAAPPVPQMQDIVPAPVRAYGENFINQVPIIGPELHNLRNTVMGPEGSAQMDALGKQASALAPGAATAGSISGAVAPYLVGGLAGGVASKALGMSGGLASQVFLGGATNAAISGADTLARGGNMQDATGSAAISGGLSAAVPLVGKAVGALVKPIVGKAVGTMGALFRPADTAQGAVGNALALDAKNSATPVLSAADQASAGANGQELLNIDRGGPNVRSLARAASNANPDARATFAAEAQDRFAGQGPRTQDFIDKLMQGRVNDIAYQQGLSDASKAANKPAYDAAMNAPEAQAIFPPQIQQLMKSDQFRAAVKAAESTGTDRAAVQGGQAVRSPFQFQADGTATLKTNPDGSQALPSLQFWDEVKRNLDGKIGIAARSGDKTGASDLMGLKSSLVSTLDATVPAYKDARAGAAAFFGADNALEAGRNFVGQTGDLRQSAAAIGKMSPAERDAFSVGFAGQMKEMISKIGDSQDTIKRIFGSQASRDKIMLALGPDKYNQFEQFVRVENVRDGLRKMLQGSDTTQKLVELGIIGAAGAGVGLTTGDWREGLTVGLLAKGGRMLGAAANREVMRQIAEILVSNDPNAMKKAVQIAAASKDGSEAVKALQTIVGGAARAGSTSAARSIAPQLMPSSSAGPALMPPQGP